MEIKDKSTCDEYYQALLNKDSKYIGVFYAAVKTTSIFCISTCRARKPKKENVIFYDSFPEALTEGFRPCKICRPTENTQETPKEVARAIDLVYNSPKEKITDYTLIQNQIRPEYLRRWFKKTYGITFHTFQRMYRINNAYKELKNGKNISESAYGNGYESLSGFSYTYKKLLGSSPSNTFNENIILIQRMSSPLGPMFVCSTDKGICLLEFTDRRMLETEFKDLQNKLKAQIIIGENDHIRQLKVELKQYFEGNLQKFTVALDHPGTDFQQLVWRELTRISYGHTSTYAEIATRIANPKAVRAIGSANGNNRISIIVPCHRVIGQNGDLVGYGGGLHRKKWLLDFEAKNSKILYKK